MFYIGAPSQYISQYQRVGSLWNNTAHLAASCGCNPPIELDLTGHPYVVFIHNLSLLLFFFQIVWCCILSCNGSSMEETTIKFVLIYVHPTLPSLKNSSILLIHLFNFYNSGCITCHSITYSTQQLKIIDWNFNFQINAFHFRTLESLGECEGLNWFYCHICTE